MIGPKPDNSAAEDKMRKGMMTAIMEGAELGAKKWAEIVSNAAANNIKKSLEEHKERKAAFLSDVDAAVARKTDENVELSMSLENLTGRTMDLTDAYQSQRETSMEAQASGYAGAWQEELYRRLQSRLDRQSRAMEEERNQSHAIAGQSALAERTRRDEAGRRQLAFALYGGGGGSTYADPKQSSIA